MKTFVKKALLLFLGLYIINHFILAYQFGCKINISWETCAVAGPDFAVILLLRFIPMLVISIFLLTFAEGPRLLERFKNPNNNSILSDKVLNITLCVSALIFIGIIIHQSHLENKAREYNTYTLVAIEQAIPRLEEYYKTNSRYPTFEDIDNGLFALSNDENLRYWSSETDHFCILFHTRGNQHRSRGYCKYKGELSKQDSNLF